MEKNISYLAILIVLLYTLYNASQKEEKVANNYTESKKVVLHRPLHGETKEFSATHLKSYIVNVINHGSNRLSFKGGEMEGGIISKDDASSVACYVLTLSGHTCKEPYSKYAVSLFQSNCAGCHGMDGSGQKGIYPDLTNGHFLGIQ